MLKKFLPILALSFFWSCSDFHKETPALRPHQKTTVTSETIEPSSSKKPARTELLPVSKINPGEQKRKHLSRNKKRWVNPEPGNPIQTHSKQFGDSLLFSKIRQLQLEDVALDLSEPLNRTYLFSGLEPVSLKGLIFLGRDRILKINFDNDILDNTDRYYTNGIRIDIISPFLKSFPLNYLMVPYWGFGTNYYGLSIVQNMYTPSTTKVGGILYGDRPYAAYLYLGDFKISNDPVKKLRQTTEMDLGIIGPYSFGGLIQKSFHATIPTNSEPLGWVYQIQNDLVLNYNLSLEKGIVSGKFFEFNLTGTSAIGTLYTNFGGGMLGRVGLFNPYFVNMGIARPKSNHKHKLRNSQFFFYVDLRGRVIGYDATLEGGIFNQTNVYTLSTKEISRGVFEGCAGITLNFGGFRFDFGQYLLSPEFHGSFWHHWVHTGLYFEL